jgi:hypothetical protein
VRREPGERRGNGCRRPGSQLGLRYQTRRNGPGGPGRPILAHIKHALRPLWFRLFCCSFLEKSEAEPKACSQIAAFAHSQLSRSANSTAAPDLLLAVVRADSSSKLPAMPPFMFVTLHELLSPVASSPERLPSASDGDPALPSGGGGLPSGGGAPPPLTSAAPQAGATPAPPPLKSAATVGAECGPDTNQ